MAEGSISYALVRKVAAEKSVDPEVLTPLHDVIDPDALESLFDDSDGSMLRDGYIVFSYEGFTVRVDHDREITLSEGRAEA
ncbi:HalOD1 output domain-containing protein [Halorientalis halophila]|jgi:hypothetical protein|uniref:HalOD1 output domain-containing protein n=1 Tax=Halorientalis halophila TaxID=3108499 RepID=UPI00300AB62B